MLDLFDSILTGSELSLDTYLICLLTAGIYGMLTAFAASFRSHASKSFLSSLILLPMIVFIFPVLIIVLLGPSLITIVEEFQ